MSISESNNINNTKIYKLKPIFSTQLSDIDINYTIDYENELNDSQLKAVKTINGPVLTIAGAGSGKTKTIVYRLARLIESGINPASILLLTFTKKAANQMVNRASLLLDSRVESVFCGTFHSFSNYILRKYSSFLELKNNFTILDKSDCEDIIKLLISKNIKKTEKRFPKSATIIEVYSIAINKNKSIESVIEQIYPNFAFAVEDIKNILMKYIEYKREKSLLDYDDLLLYLKTLLTSNESVRSKISNQYKYIMIDEYQDTNSLQSDIVKLIAYTHNNVMAVGDDSQSIYSFRGADFKNILNFPKIFENTKIIKLEQNYRSSQNILALANKILEKASQKYTKELFSNINFEQKPILVAANDMEFEAKFVTQRILELIQEENLSLNDISILSRSARLTYNLEIELSKANLPYKKFGGLKFIEARHVKDVIAFLRCIVNPDDFISLNRILLLLDGVGNQTALKIIPIFSQNLLSTSKKTNSDEMFFNVSLKNKSNIISLFNFLNSMKNQITSPSYVLKQVLDFYTPILKSKYDDYLKRIKDLDHLLFMSESYNNLEQFISDLALEPPDTSVTDVKGTFKDEYLTISTIHSAKGLEWNTVFIIGACDGKFPSIFSFNNPDDLEEELRLFYVAVTRAKKHLYISYPINMYDNYSGFLMSKPSRFLDNINNNIIDRWVLA